MGGQWVRIIYPVHSRRLKKRDKKRDSKYLREEGEKKLRKRVLVEGENRRERANQSPFPDRK